MQADWPPRADGTSAVTILSAARGGLVKQREGAIKATPAGWCFTIWLRRLTPTFSGKAALMACRSPALALEFEDMDQFDAIIRRRAPLK